MEEQNIPVVANEPQTQHINGRQILKASIKRNNIVGLQIELQSCEDWSFLSDKHMRTIGNIPCYFPAQETLDGVKGYFVASNVHIYNNLPNLQLLLARDIKNGVKFNFGMIPMSDSKVLEWLALFKEQVKVLYLTYLKPYGAS